MKTDDLLLLGAVGYLFYTALVKPKVSQSPSQEPTAPITTPTVKQPTVYGISASQGPIYTPLTETIVNPVSGQLMSGIPNPYTEVKDLVAVAPLSVQSPTTVTKVSSPTSSSSSSTIKATTTASSEKGQVSTFYLTHSNPAVAANAAVWAASGKVIPASLR
jgi:hypothetical protein